MQLRTYQEKFITDIRQSFNAGNHCVCGVAPCGSGKTVMAAEMVRQALNRNHRVVFMVHRHELIEQTAKTFANFNIPFGIIASHFTKNYQLPVQIASVQTLTKRLDEVIKPDFVICDECHHILAETYLRIIDKWRNLFLLGLTATPERLGGVRLGDVFDAMVLAPTVKELTRLGNLTPFHYYSPLKIDLENLKVKRGDYDTRQSSQLMSQTKIITNIVENYLRYAEGKQTICYCVNVAHSKLMTAQFNAAGILAAHCDAETPKNERQKIINDFRLGKLKILCNVNLFSEGFDVPNMDAVILARPTKSLSLFIQQAMRVLRPNPTEPGKVAIILDCVSNVEHFGLPDEKHHWSLDPNEVKAQKTMPTKECPKCHERVPLATRFCTCGYEFKTDTAVNAIKGVLNKVSTSLDIFIQKAAERGYKRAWAAYRALETAESFQDCKYIAQVIGYQPGWAWYQWQNIQRGLPKFGHTP